MESVGLNAEEIAHNQCILTDKVVSHMHGVNSCETAMRVY